MSSKKFSEKLTLILLIFFFAFGMYVYFFVVDNGGLASSGSFFSDIIKSLLLKDEKLNVLVLGLDEVSQSTDTVLVVNFDCGKKRINILSIPRDTKVRIHGTFGKINSAYAKGGAELALNTVSSLLRIPVDSYILFDMQAFRKVIDALDGVYINIAEDMHYDDPVQNLHIHLKKGYQLLDGKKAEQFVRYRWGYTGGDLGRVEAQQEFIKALISQKMNSRNISRINSIIDIAYKHIKTNIKLDDALKYTRSIIDIGSENIHFFILPGNPVEEDVWYYIFDEKETDDLIRKHFAGIIFDNPYGQKYVLASGINSNQTYSAQNNNTNSDDAPDKVQLITEVPFEEDNLTPKSTSGRRPVQNGAVVPP